jgi:hypothetical protein
MVVPQVLKKIFIKIYYIVILLVNTFFITWIKSLFTEIPFYVHIHFLTNITIYLNISYYIYSLGILFNFEIFLDFKKLFFKLCFILTFANFLLYWLMVLIDPELKLMLPYYLDLFLHGGTFLINTAEHLIINSKYSEKFTEYNFYFYFLILILYSIPLSLIYKINYYKYPILEEISIVQYIVMSVSTAGSFFLGHYIFKMLINK